MFGYVMPRMEDLTQEERERYHAAYCGVCRALGERFGQRCRVALTYDMTFLAILLSALYEPETTDETHRCLAHPVKKRRMIRSKYTDYVADMNVLLSYYKALDDWIDDHNVLKLAFSKIINSRHDDYREKADAIASLLNELGTREKENETNIDTMAGIFGNIMAVLFVPQKDQWSKSLERMGFFLGKFIYILDAYDDLENDIKKKKYNPFKSVCKESGFDDNIKAMLTMMMAECSKEFETLPIIEHANILRNILYAGVWSVYYRRLKERNVLAESHD